MRRDCWQVITALLIILVLVSCKNGDIATEELVAITEKPAVTSTAEMDVIDVQAGGWHSLLLKADGTVWAWGENQRGALGNGTTENSSSMVQIVGLANVTAISAGGGHNLALRDDGTVWAWGENEHGQLGIGSKDTQLQPVQISGLPSIKKIAAGPSDSIALDNDGHVWVWGNNTYQRSSFEDDPPWLVPKQIETLSDTVDIDAGGLLSAALSKNGIVWIWGAWPDYEHDNLFDPVEIEGLTEIVAISAGAGHLLALDQEGNVWAYGDNSEGQLGNGEKLNEESGTYIVETPTRVVNLFDVRQIEAEQFHSVAIKSDGTVWAWGSNSTGILGAGSSGDDRKSPTPVSVDLPRTAIDVSVYSQCLVILEDDSVWGWGRNIWGEIRNAEPAAIVFVPTQIYPNEE